MSTCDPCPNCIAQIKAEALREAADWLNGREFPHGEGDWLDGCVDTLDGLRAYAARIAAKP